MVAQPMGTKKTAIKPAHRPPSSLTNISATLQPPKKSISTQTKSHGPTPIGHKKPLPPAYKSSATAQPPRPPKQSNPQPQSWLTKSLSAVSTSLGSAASAATTGLGNAAGAVVTATGNGVNGAGKGVGSSITNTTRTWGDTVREYGNSLKDITGAGGSRAPTKGNPLGLRSSREGSAGNPLGL